MDGRVTEIEGQGNREIESQGDREVYILVQGDKEIESQGEREVYGVKGIKR